MTSDAILDNKKFFWWSFWIFLWLLSISNNNNRMTCSTATVNIIYNSTFIIQKISRISIYICANRPNLKSFSQSLWIILFNCIMFINFN